MVDKISLSHLAYTLLKPQERYNEEMNFVSSSEDVKVRLKFLSHIKKDQKIDTKNLKLQNNGYLCSVSRFVFPDNRMNTIKFIKDVINRTFEIIDFYTLSNRTTDLKMLLEDLIKSITGLDNLKQTYDTDTLFICHIDAIIESITSKLSSLNIIVMKDTKEVTKEETKEINLRDNRFKDSLKDVPKKEEHEKSPSIMSISSNVEISTEELP